MNFFWGGGHTHTHILVSFHRFLIPRGGGGGCAPFFLIFHANKSIRKHLLKSNISEQEQELNTCIFISHQEGKTITIHVLFNSHKRTGLVHFFFTAPESVLYFSIGLGVHAILYLIPAKIVDEQKEEKIL